jgi:hypothetical protein
MSRTPNVKCFSAAQKDLIVSYYNAKIQNITQIAKNFHTSTRTIGRVLEERGLATPVPRLKGDAYQVMEYLKTMDITNAKELKWLMADRFITERNVQKYLNRASKDHLTTLFYNAAWHHAKAAMAPSHANLHPAHA